MTRIFVFPGQGAQFVGMGRDLFSAYPDLVAKADAVLGYSIVELCLKNLDGKLAQTEYTQPALFVVNALNYYHRRETLGDDPDFVAGHSLGEYNALLAAEAFDFETGLRLVQKRGALMGAFVGGGMAAVIGCPREQIEAVLRSSGVATVDVANFNSPGQTVLSGPTADLEQLAPRFSALDRVRYVPLNVRTAFHSRYMSPVKAAFASFVADYRFNPLTVPVIANFTALPYRDDEIAHNLVQQIDHSVRWLESVQYLLQENDPAFEELGPGQVLTRLIAEIRQAPIPVNIARHY